MAFCPLVSPLMKTDKLVISVSYLLDLSESRQKGGGGAANWLTEGSRYCL